MIDIAMDWPTAHRPWPLPDGPWVMFQQWEDLLFAHWPLPPEALRPLVPDCFPLDTFQGQAWIGLTPFRVEGLRTRFAPPLPWVSDFPELNVRTYVTLEDRPGVYFFSLDAGNPLAVAAARAFFKVPYYTAEMSVRQDGPYVRYHSRRAHDDAPEAELIAWYRPTGEVFQAERGTLEHFLAERYCFYTLDDSRDIWRCDIHHRPWPLQPAEVGLERNTMTAGMGLALPDLAPRLHFARAQPTVIWPLRRIG